MTESLPPSDPETPAGVTDDATTSPAATDAGRSPAPPRLRFKRLLILWAICLLIGGGAQAYNILNDTGVQNVTTMLAVLVALAGTLVWLYRNLQRHTSRVVATATVALLVLAPVVLFRFRGFSGAMIPQFELRFAVERALQSVTTEATAVDLDWVAEADFPQFLGPRRQGIVSARMFDLPAEDLQPLWRIDVGEGWAGFAVAGPYAVTLEQRGDQECVCCYRLVDGELLWLHSDQTRHRNPLGGVGPRSTPTIHADLVYTQGASGIVNCLDLHNGQLLWTRHLIEAIQWDQDSSERAISWGRASSPLLADGLCILPLGAPADWQQRRFDTAPLAGRSLVALDAADGSLRWTAGDDQISYASPVRLTVGGVDQVISVNEKTLSGHRLQDGHQLWTENWPGSSIGSANCSSAIQVDADAILIAKGYGRGSQVLELDGDETQMRVSERWSDHRLLKTKFTHACVRDRFAFGLSDGTLQCVDLVDGRRLWDQPRGGRYGHGQVILVEDLLVVQTEAGEVALVAASDEAFQPLMTLAAMSSKTWNIPAVAGRHLVVRNDRHAYCFHLPASP